jgi:hypothetical protein
LIPTPQIVAALVIPCKPSGLRLSEKTRFFIKRTIIVRETTLHGTRLSTLERQSAQISADWLLSKSYTFIMSSSRPPPPRGTIESFALMFGQKAADAMPSSYHLMLLSERGGLDVHIPSEAMIEACHDLARHEDAFAWSAMSAQAECIHAGLLDCVVARCAHLAGNHSARIAHAPARAIRDDASETFFAYCRLPDNDSSENTLLVVETMLSSAISAAHCSRIPERLAAPLASALEDESPTAREGLLLAAAEAIALRVECDKALPPRNAPRI